MTAKIRFVFLGLVLAGSLGCSSEEPQGDDDPCDNGSCRAAGAANTTAVSFAMHVAPILQKNCNTVSCHGFTGAPTATLPAAGLFLGTGTAVDGAQVVTNLQAMSNVATGRQIVVPSDAASSFLMHKVDGCQGDRGLTCAVPPDYSPESGGQCGDPMPPPSYPGLCEGDVEVLRAWIAQGAMNN